MIVEFVGIPGCGKSTIARAMEMVCADSGETVTMYQNPLKRNLFFKICQSAYIVMVSLFERKTRSILSKIAKIQIHLLWENGIKAYKSMPFLFKILLIFRYCGGLKEDNIIIIEQGVFQYLSSALFKMRYAKKIIKDFVSENMLTSENWHVVFCDIEIDECMNRLKNRKNGLSRIEKYPQSQWEQELRDQMIRYEDIKRICLFMFEKNVCLSTTNVSPDENALIICKRIGIICE